MGKRFYWLKLKDNFFDKKEIKRLRRMAGGDTYTIIYLKMLLLSLKTSGDLYFDDIGDDFADELSLEIDEDIDNTKMTLSYLQSKGLLEIVSDNEYHLKQLPFMIGSESESAERVKRHRANKEQKALHSNDSVTLGNEKVTTEKEIEKEIDIEKEVIPYVEIINYLNDVSGKNYRSSTRKTKDLIKARWNEGFRLDDFKQVIDTKNAEWQHDQKMSQFIRPDTLFGTKFEGYLNQKGIKTDDPYDNLF